MDFMSKDFDLAENVFYFLNSNLKSMAFVLDWDTKDKFYSNLLTMNCADVLDTQNDHAMVLAIPEETKYFHPKIPAFNIKYIKDCFNIKDFPDPTKYLINHTSPASYSKEQLDDCLGHQTKSWSDLVPIPQNRKESSYVDFDDIMVSSDTPGGFISKNTRMPYTHNEESSIVKYIINNNCAFDVSGVKIWKNMERENVCKLRTWQSMKQRYLKYIRSDLNSGNQKFKFISSEDLKLLRQGLNIEKIEKSDKIAIKSSINEKRIEDWNL